MGTWSLWVRAIRADVCWHFETKLQSRCAPSSCAVAAADMGTSSSRANFQRNRVESWRFVRFGRESGQVTGIDEFEVASALFAGETGLLLRNLT